MRKLKPNEKIIKEYELFILIEVACPHGNSYKTTIDKWTSKDEAKVDKSQNRSTYDYLGLKPRNIYLYL